MKHVDYIRSLPCWRCKIVPAGVAHHLRRTGESGMGLKSPDKYRLPLCANHHNGSRDSVHLAGMNETEWFQTYTDIDDPVKEAETLYSIWVEFEEGQFDED